MKHLKISFMDVCLAGSCLQCQTLILDKKMSCLCLACLSKIAVIDTLCELCGKKLEGDPKYQVCVECLKEKPAYDAFYTIGAYEAELRDMILMAKQGRQHKAINALQHVCLHYAEARFLVSDYTKHTAIVFPTSPLTRLFLRGFNFAEELIKPLANQYRIPIVYAFSPIFYQRKQAKLNLLERQKAKIKLNVRKDIILPETVIIFDDIVTTGKTVSVMANALKQSGVKKVVVWSLARRFLQ